MIDMNYYVRLTKGLYDKGILVKPEEVQGRITDWNKDWYQSTYYYDEEQYKKFLTTKSVKGIRQVTTNRIWADFDSETDLELARFDAIKFVDNLLKYDIKENQIEVYFSGGKGYNVIFTLDRFLSPDQVHSLAVNKFGRDLKTLDKTLYDASQVLRVPATKHQKTGLFKIPLTVKQLRELDSYSIKTMAVSLDSIEDEFNWGVVQASDDLLEVEEPSNKSTSNIKKSEYKLDLTTKPKHWTNCKFSLLQGNFKIGERHNAMMVIASTCKSLGYDAITTTAMCKSADEKHIILTGDKPCEDIETNIIPSIFESEWGGGSYTCKKPGWLQDYCQSLGEFQCKNEKTEEAIIGISKLEESFKSYAQNFDKNIISTGIPELDENVMFLCSTSNGILGSPGCHAPGTKVIMFDGTFKNVEDVVIGDLLMGPDSTPREVLKLIQGVDEMYEITPNKGEKFVINQHHILNLKPSARSTKKAFECNLNIMFKDYLEHTSKVVKCRYKIHRSPINFSEKKLLIDPYILGEWLGDGTSSLPTFTSMDNEIIEYLQQYGNSIGDKVNIYGKQNSKAKTISFVGQKFKNKLIEEHLLNNKHVPHKYLTGSKQQRLELLAGLLDSDGHLDNNHTGFQFINKNKLLSDAVVYLSRSVGLAAYISYVRKGCSYKGQIKEGMYWSVSISGNVDIIPTKVKRKKAKKRKINKDALVTGFSYKALGEGKYYGFTLDKDHLYLTDDFIVHHNSGKSSIALQMLKHQSKLGSASLFYSLDMAMPIVYTKLIQDVKGCSFKDATDLYVNNPKECERVFPIIQQNYANVDFNFKSGITVEDIKNDIKRQEEVTGKKVRLLIIDYLECLSGPYSDATANTAYISNQLKDLASEMNVCSIMLLQTQKHGAGISEPLLSMRQIKGASVIEQSCTVVLTMWREGYDPKTVHEDKYVSLAAVKNRLGSLWSDDFKWNGIRGQISSLDEIGREDLAEFRKWKKQMKAEEEKEKNKGWT